MKTKETTLKEPVQTEILFRSRLSNKSLPKSNIIWRLNPLALNVQFSTSAKHFSFVKRERLFRNYFFSTYLLHKKLVMFDILVIWLMKEKARNRSKTSLAKSYCKKDVKPSVK